LERASDFVRSPFFIVVTSSQIEILMKVRTTAQIKALFIDGDSWELSQPQKIDLEFSAIDAGGGFKDPILDFSFTIPKSDTADFEGEEHELTVTLNDPDEAVKEAEFSYKGVLREKGEDLLEVNGRLKEDRLSREIIGFVLNLLR
jgi:hypothetical protein